MKEIKGGAWWRRSKRYARKTEGPSVLRALSALLQSGLPPRIALGRLQYEIDSPLLRDLDRRLRLGEDLEHAVQRLEPLLGSVACSLACVLSVHTRMGGDLATMVNWLSAAAEERAEAIAAGRASGAGALLSGRIVAGLPLLLFPLAPMARTPLLDPLGIAMLFLGGALAVTGTWWVAKLVPRPPQSDPAGVFFAEILACTMSGGAPLHGALNAIAEADGTAVGPALRRARGRVRLGESWPDALERVGDESLAALASEVRLAQSMGTPAGPVLRRWAAARRANARREFDIAMRRAPVLMVVPLSVCVLPAYALLGLGPYVRGLL